MTRRSFSAEFKRQAVLLVLNEGVPVQTVAIKLEIHTNTLYRWIQEYEKHGERSFPGKGSHEFVRQNEMKRLEKENKKLKEELDLLKKFKAFLKANQK
ncbi:MAG TPA: transposase [Erysipelothrix sp.]|nr:transposase [Erysipelothrix sp.]